MSEPSLSGSPASTICPFVTRKPRPAREAVLPRIGQLAARVERRRRDRDLHRALGILDVDLARDVDERRRALRVPRLEDLDDARKAVRDVVSGDAARVERPHRELRPRLADRLRGDDADRVADLGHAAGGEEGAVAVPADPPLAAALEHRANRDRRGLGVLAELLDELPERARGDLGALRDDDRLAGLAVLERLADVLRRDPTGDALVRHVVEDERQLDVLARSAVGRNLARLLADDHVLRHVDEPPREVARVGGAQRRVREALAGTVRRDEVLEDGEALHEVRLDRAGDDLPLRIGHEAAHARELADLVERSAGSRVGHHVDRVRRLEVVHHPVGDLVRRLRPDGDDALVALLLGHQAAVVLLADLADLVLEPGEDLLLVAAG